MANLNTFQSVANKYQNSPVVVLIFVVSLAMLIFGINNFAEDVYSSYLGLRDLEEAYSLNVQIWSFTYWVMSASFQVATIIFFFLFVSTNDRKYLWISLAVQAVDFFADAWYRSNGQLFDSISSAVMSGLFTFFFFTIGSEVFVTIGFGLVMALYAPALREWNKARGNVQAAKNGGGGGGGSGGGGGKQNQYQSGKHRGGGSGSGRRAELERAYRAAGNNGYKPSQAHVSLLGGFSEEDE